MANTVEDQHAGRLRGSLSVPAIVYMVVAAAAPLTCVAGVFPIGFAYGNGAAFPTMFLLIGVLLLLFSVGFTAMSRCVSKPGAFFTYVANGLGRPAGLGAAYAAILCYTGILVGVLGYVGSELAGTFDEYLGLDLPWLVWTGIAIAFAGFLGFRHVELSAKVLGVLLTLEIGVVLVISLLVIAEGGANGLDLQPFNPGNLLDGAPALAVMFAAASFIGFEATAIFRDEAADPDRTVPRATYAAVIVIAAFYTFSSWAFVMAWGSDDVAEAAATEPTFFFTTAEAQLGGAGEFVGRLLVITSIFAAVLAFHNIATRYVHALATAEVLPSALCGLSKRDGAPAAASLTITAVSSALVVICAVVGLEPYLEMFTWFVGVGAMIYLTLLAACTLSVLVFFARRNDTGENVFGRLVAPALALVGLCGATYITADNFPLLVGDVDAAGVPAFGTLSMCLLGAVVASVVIGVVHALVLRSKGSQAYDDITEVGIEV